jgi:putative ATP-dependent endonuclease of OLD family
MEISDIKIQNYKSIDETKITEVTDLSILVGKNNAGKSSVLEAVRMFLKPLAKPYAEQFHMGNKDDIVITGTFTNVPDDLRNELDDDVEFDGEDLEIRREWEYPEHSRRKANTFIGGDKLTATTLPDKSDMNKTGVREFIWDFLPEVLYVPAERNISEEASFKSNTLIERLLSPLLDENDDIRDQRMNLGETLDNSVGNIQSSVQSELTQHMDSISGVNIDIGTVDLYKAFSPSITVNDQYSDEQVPIGERGSGIGSMLVLSMIEAYRKGQVGDEYLMLFRTGELASPRGEEADAERAQEHIRRRTGHALDTLPSVY